MPVGVDVLQMFLAPAWAKANRIGLFTVLGQVLLWLLFVTGPPCSWSYLLHRASLTTAMLADDLFRITLYRGRRLASDRLAAGWSEPAAQSSNALPPTNKSKTHRNTL